MRRDGTRAQSLRAVSSHSRFQRQGRSRITARFIRGWSEGLSSADVHVDRTHSSSGFQKDSVLRIVSSVIIVLALASPARLARAGDQGAEAQHGAHTGATSSAFVEEVRRATASFRDIRNLPAPQGCAKLLEGG